MYVVLQLTITFSKGEARMNTKDKRIVPSRLVIANALDNDWMRQHTNMMENGGCPVCYQDDESIFTHGHKEGCEFARLESTNTALLEALEYIVDHYPSYQGIPNARLAIRKASR